MDEIPDSETSEEVDPPAAVKSSSTRSTSSIKLLRQDLTCPKRCKYAANTIKNFVAELSETKVISESSQAEELLWNCNYSSDNSKLFLFWADFFELLEILDEKQSHIIQPVVKDKIKIFRALTTTDNNATEEMDTTLCEWFCVVLWKMIHHDNRLIVKEGLVRFLKLGNFQKTNSRRQKVLLTFLDQEILPLIKEHVGWILWEADEFFQVTEKFGIFLRNVHEDPANKDDIFLETKIVTKILNFLLQDGTCLSPASVFFLVRSLGYSVNAGKLLDLPKCEDRDNSLLERCISLLNKTVSQGLRTVYPFLKHEVEVTLQNILVNRMFPVLEAAETMTPEIDVGRTPMFSNILSLIGAIDLTVFIHNYSSIRFSWFEKKYQSYLLAISGSKLSQEEKAIFHLYIGDLNRTEFIGLVRMAWVPARLDQGLHYIFEKLYALFLCNLEAGGRNISEGFVEYLNYAINSSDSDDHSLLKRAVIMRSSELKENLVELLVSRFDYPFEETKYFSALVTVSLVEVLQSPLKNEELAKLSEKSNSKIAFVLDELYFFRKEKSLEFEFLTWKVLGVLNSCDFDDRVLTNIVKLYLYDTAIGASEEIDEENFRMVYGDDFRTQLYQPKFTSLIAIFTNFGLGREVIPAGNNSILDVEKWREFLPCVMENVDKTGFGGVINATKCVSAMLNCLLRSFPDLFIELSSDTIFRSQLQEYLQLAWNLTFEMRKTDTFWAAMKELTSLIVNPAFSGQQILTEYTDKIFQEGETVLGLTLILMKSLRNCITLHWKTLQIDAESDYAASMLNDIVQVCVKACISGSLLPKNYRVAFGLWEHLRANTEQHCNSSNAIYSSVFTKTPRMRLVAIQNLQTILQNLLDHSQLKDNILQDMLDYFLAKQDEDLNKRYFGSSILHRKKQRIAQALLIFQPMYSVEQNSALVYRLLDALSEESLQPSVRYFDEWIICKILLKHWNLWNSFFDKSVKCWSKRIGFGTYFSSICLHVANLLPRTSETEVFFEKALRNMTQLVLGHHVTVRVYAQACYHKILESFKSSADFPHLLSRHEIIFSSLSAARELCVGNSAKILNALENDFYIQMFNPDTHYRAEVIFIYLPQLSQVATDELPTEICLESCNVKTEYPGITTASSESLLSKELLKELYHKYEKLAWHLKTTPVSGRELGEEVPLEPDTGENNPLPPSTSSNFQKKINPWKTLAISEPLMDDMSEKLVTKKRSAMEGGLVVVGSLVDKIPNLGGLCRSCEIFGVSTYVIPSMKILDDHQFQNLAVSAHNWVNIIEVPPKDLESFLATYKAKGYSILGIEQAQESTQLNHFKFPRKSLLLLGNEKYGIPTNLLDLMDHCIEIPQIGVIRSMNVHVTGALCIFAYASQHAFAS